MPAIVTITNGPLAATIATGYGNIATSLQLEGREFLWTPETRDHHTLCGVPLLAPWANRIDGDSYFANGRRYLLNPDATDLRRDGNGLPIHGLLMFCECWRVVHQDASSVTSRLEFWRRPEWMAQFPFAHTIEITHRLSEHALEVETAIENLAAEPMPLCIGFHPYFQLTDSPRDAWKLTVPARESVVLSDKLVPTGETAPVSFVQPFPLEGASLDAVFKGLTGEAFVAQGPTQRLSVRFGPKYPVAIVYAPPGKPFFCFEPMTALTNAFNLDHAGKRSELQHIAPGEAWRESFWIAPEV